MSPAFFFLDEAMDEAKMTLLVDASSIKQGFRLVYKVKQGPARLVALRT